MNHVTITRRFILATFAVVSVAACRHQVAPLSPSAASETVRQFLAAVNANNLDRMLELWGDERGLVGLEA